jgi:hypothetical protein
MSSLELPLHQQITIALPLFFGSKHDDSFLFGNIILLLGVYEPIVLNIF